MVAPTREDPVARRASEVVGGPLGDHARPHRWWSAPRVLLAVATLTWLVTLLQKVPCARGGWQGSALDDARLCATRLPDTLARGPLDTPLGTVDGPDVVAVAAVVLLPVLLLAVLLLAGAQPGRPWDAMALAASPLLVLTGLVGWDLVGVLVLAAALWAHAHARPLLTGALVGVGTAVALHPVVLLPAAVVVAVRRGRTRDLAWLVPAAVAGWVVVALLATLTRLATWEAVLRAGPAEDLGSTWTLLPGDGRGAGAVLLPLLLLAVVVVLGLRAPDPPRLSQLALLLAVGLQLVAPVHTPEMALWLLPLAALALPRWRDLLLWQAFAVASFVCLTLSAGGFTTSATTGGDDPALLAGVLLQVVGQLLLVALVLRDLWRPERDPVAASEQDRAALRAGVPVRR